MILSLKREVKTLKAENQYLREQVGCNFKINTVSETADSF